MKDPRFTKLRVCSATVFLLWLSSTEEAWAFSAVQGFARGVYTASASSALQRRAGMTRIFFEPLPNPGVPSHKPETKIVEKEVYDEPEDEAKEATREDEPKPALDEEEEGEQAADKEKVDMKDHMPIGVKSDMESFGDFLKILKERHEAVLVALILMAALLLNPLPAMAAVSGGRMGGSYPSQRASPSTRSYSSGYPRGLSSERYYYSRPTVYVNPYPSPFSAFPTFSPFWSPSYTYSRPGIVVGARGPGLLEFLVVGVIALAVANAVGVFSGGSSSTSFFEDNRGTVSSALGPGVSVAKVSVALEVPRRDDRNSILSALDRISRTARTDSRVGIQNLTSQVALELLRRKSSIVSASTKYNHYNDRERAQREFNNIAIKERAKFERETVSQYGGVDYTPQRSNSKPDLSTTQATMAVVTMIIAIEGDSTHVPRITSVADVEDALSRVASDSKVDNFLQSAEILWTPEERTDTLTDRDVVADYPDLRSI